MKRLSLHDHRVIALALIPALGLAFAPGTEAADFDIPVFQVGGYYGPYRDIDFADPVPDPPLFAPDIDPADQVYFLGRSTFEGATTSERRAYFIYDASSFTIPAGEMITSVSVELVVVPGSTSALANFTGFEEIVKFSGTPFTKEEILDEALTPADPIAMWDSFGTGPDYGAFDFIAPGHPSLPVTTTGSKTVPLPGAAADLEAAISSGDYFILTARLDTYDPDPIDPNGDGDFGDADIYEYVFGLTDVVKSGVPILSPAPTLSYTTSPVPEPTTALVFGLGLPLLMRRRSRG